jgi:hypothetical protein
MPTRTHLVAVARSLKQQLNGHAFLTIQRTEITKRLREVSGQLPASSPVSPRTSPPPW